MDLGRRLRELRRNRALSLYQVADRLGVHFSTIGKYERGVRQPGVAVLRRLAGLYEVDLAELLETGEHACRADARQRLRERPDLQVLLEIARRLTPEQVLLLTDLLRTLTDRVRPRPRDGAAAAELPGPSQLPEGSVVMTGHVAERTTAWSERPGRARPLPGAGDVSWRPARVRGAGRPPRPRRQVRTIARGPAPPLVPGVLPRGMLQSYVRHRGGRAGSPG